MGGANIERCITKFNAILSCRIFGTPYALNHRPICKVWQGWWKNISPRGEVNRSAVLACAALANYDGGLIAYAANYADLYLRAASFVDKIFKGTKPAELPVEQLTKFELFINGKTAKALGLTIPQALLISADKVIE